MKSSILIVTVAAVVVTIAPHAWAQRSKANVNQAYVEAFGRNATSDEINYWMQQRNDWNTKQDLVNRHVQYIKGNPNSRRDVVDASYWVAFGRAAIDGERNYWGNQRSDWTTHQSLVALHSQYLRANPGERRKVVNQSYLAAFGKDATEGERNYWANQRSDWTTHQRLVELHSQYIKGNADVSREVIRRSYLNVFQREPNDGEKSYWFDLVKRHGYTYALLTSRHKVWIAQEVARTMSSPDVVKQLKAGNLAVNSSGELVKVAPSQAGTRVSNGTGTVVAAQGAWGLIAAPKSSLISDNGSGLIGNDAGSLIGQDGASLIGQDGASLISNASGTLIGDGAGTFKAGTLVRIDSAGRIVAAGAGN